MTAATFADLDAWVADAAKAWRDLDVRGRTSGRTPTDDELARAEQLVDALNGLGLLDGDAAALGDADKATAVQLGDALATLASRARKTANGLRPGT